MYTQKKCIIGLEWDIVDSLQSIYCSYVLGYDPTKPTQGADLTWLTNTYPTQGSTGGGSAEQYGSAAGGGEGGGGGGQMEGSEVSAVEKGKLLLSRRQAGVEEAGFLNDFPRRVSVCQTTGCTAMICLYIVLATYTTHTIVLIIVYVYMHRFFWRCPM